MNYVLHECKNPDCNNGWIDKNLTNVTMYPPKWKYCKDCCNKLNIDFDKQRPNSNLTEDERIKRKEKMNKMLEVKRLKQNQKSILNS